MGFWWLVWFGAQGRAKVTDLVVHLRLRFHGLGHLFPQELAISSAEMMEQTFDRQLRHSQSARKLFVTNLLTVRGEMTLQDGENSAPSFAFAFQPQPAQRLFGNRRGPARVKERFGWRSFHSRRRQK